MNDLMPDTHLYPATQILNCLVGIGYLTAIHLGCFPLSDTIKKVTVNMFTYMMVLDN